MVDQRYLRPGFDFALAHAIEEAGEFLAAAGKTARWGRQSVNPELPVPLRETNEDWLSRELDDLRGALDRLSAAITLPSLTVADLARLPSEPFTTTQACTALDPTGMVLKPETVRTFLRQHGFEQRNRRRLCSSGLEVVWHRTIRTSGL